MRVSLRRRSEVAPIRPRGVLEQDAELFARTDERVGGLVVDQLPAASRDLRHTCGGDLLGGDRGDAVDEFVRFVDHHHLVLGEDRRRAHRVDRQHRVVGDDDVRRAGFAAGDLGEAVFAVRAVVGAEALS